MPTHRRVLAALIAISLLAAACGDDGGAGATADDRAADDPVTTSTTSTTTSTTEAPGPQWVAHETGPECLCADGSDFWFHSRTSSPDKVVLYFQGGGACFSEETCSFTDGSYFVTTGPDAHPGAAGIFDFDNPDNPLRDWSMVFVPYCTGDVHLGDATTTYGDDLVAEHNGFVNARHGLDFLVSTFPDASEVLVTGSSAGGIPSPLFGGLVSDELPDADVAVLADGSGGYPSNPPTNSFLGGLWGTENIIPGWPVLDGVDASTFGIPDLFSFAGRHDPDIRMARFDNAYDFVQRDFSALAGIEGDLLDVLELNEANVEATGVDLDVYIAPGEDHTILGRDSLYDLEVEGVAFVDWLTEFVEGDSPGDVACTDCGNPDAAA